VLSIKKQDIQLSNCQLQTGQETSELSITKREETFVLSIKKQDIQLSNCQLQTGQEISELSIEKHERKVPNCQ